MMMRLSSLKLPFVVVFITFIVFTESKYIVQKRSFLGGALLLGGEPQLGGGRGRLGGGFGGPLLGGWSSPYSFDGNSVDVGTPDSSGKCSEAAIKNEFSFCEAAHKTMKNKSANSELLAVCNPQSQLVAGTNFKFNLLIKDGETINNCDATTWKQLSGEIEVTKWQCSDAAGATDCSSLNGRRKKRSLLGGAEAVDTTQDDTQEAAQFAVDQINRASNSLFMHSLQRVLRVTRQVVNGFRYRITLITAPTSCRNSQENYGKTLEMCPVSNTAQTQKCKVSVVYSLYKYSMEDFKCMPGQKIFGGENDHSAPKLGGDDHDYKIHVNKPLLGGDDHDYKVHESKPLLGGDDHDFQIHGNPLGGDGHDHKDHGMESNLLGRDSHDYIKHPNVLRSLMDKIGTPVRADRGSDNVQRMTILGGDDHDYQPHESACVQYKDEFEQFKVTHQRFYGDLKEETQRFQVFCENMGKMKKIQAMERGSAKYGVTQFSDLTEEEFQKKYMGLKPSANTRELPKAKIPTGPIPDSWDWRDHGAVTQVKNQGSCGSCWAFSTTGNVEGQWAIQKKKLLSLSEQELVDCDKVDEGCNGGLPSQAYDAIMKLGGLETEKDYAYKGHGEKCLFNKTEAKVKVTGAVNISQDESEMAAWLYHNGPISIGINAFGMQFYWGGIAHPWKMFCSPSGLDHGVLIVGYGVENNEPYWIVKNSWGPTWGREGYYYVYRGDGTCGLNMMCTSATVE